MFFIIRNLMYAFNSRFFAHVTFVRCELMIAALRLVFIHSLVRHDSSLRNA